MPTALQFLGIFSKSREEGEKRVPIHPAHIKKLPPQIGKQIYLEEGYGKRFGFQDSDFTDHVAGIVKRSELLEKCDAFLLMPQMIAEDLYELPEITLAWAWAHCYLHDELTEAAIKRKLTVIGFEDMYHDHSYGRTGLHVFHQNNEIAGYSSVTHALSERGLGQHYSQMPLRAAVIGFGSTGRGAVTALDTLGIRHIEVLSGRQTPDIANPIPGVQFMRLSHPQDTNSPSRVSVNGSHIHLAEYLGSFDIVVNCVEQNPARPRTFATYEDLRYFKPESVIIDVSVDLDMGFEWAQHTTLADPLVKINDRVFYYAVTNSPARLWQATTEKISEALIPFLGTALSGNEAITADPVLGPAVQILKGNPVDPKIVAKAM